MSDSYEVCGIDDDSAWDALVRQGVGGTVFATSAWLGCAQEALQAPVRRWGCVRNGRLVAGVSGVESCRAGCRRLFTPELTPHGGFQCLCPAAAAPGRAEAEQHRTAGLLCEYLEGRYAHVHLTHAPALTDMRPFAWAGHQVRVRYTYRIPLTSPEDLWQRLERRTRTVVRKAASSGWQIRPAPDLELFADLYARVYQRQGQRQPVPVDAVKRFVRQALGAGLAQAVAVVSPADQTAAVVVFVADADQLYAWVAGADPVHNASGALSLLYCRVLETATARTFDFVGANLPSIAMFKRGFGGNLTPYYTSERFASRALRLLVPLWRAQSVRPM
jgi:hypothetical protein